MKKILLATALILSAVTFTGVEKSHADGDEYGYGTCYVERTYQGCSGVLAYNVTAHTCYYQYNGRAISFPNARGFCTDLTNN